MWGGKLLTGKARAEKKGHLFWYKMRGEFLKKSKACGNLSEVKI